MGGSISEGNPGDPRRTSSVSLASGYFLLGILVVAETYCMSPTALADGPGRSPHTPDDQSLPNA